MGHSVEVTPLAAERAARLSSGWFHLQGWSLLLLVFWLYHSILYRLVVQWKTEADFSYCFVAPAFSLFILWQDRRRLASIAPAPSWTGLAFVILGLLMLVVGVLGVELFTSRLSLIVLLTGLIVLFQGWTFFRFVLFPWAFLILMIPLPNLIQQRLTFPLQILASQLATGLLRTIGIVVNREGNIINLATTHLEVAQACSGLRSLLSLIILAIIYGYLVERRIWVRVVLACAAVPIAVVANSFRIFITGVLVQSWDPDKVEGFFHYSQGLLIFAICMILLFAVHGLINLIWKDVSSRRGAAAPRAEAHSQFKRPSTALTSAGNRAPRFLAAMLLLLATAVFLWAHPQNEILPPRQSLSSLPGEIDGWTSQSDTLDEQTLEILGHPEYVVRTYSDVSGQQPWVDLFIAYYPTQKAGETPHTPAHCLPGAGWVPTQRQTIALNAPDGSSFPVNRYVVSKGGERQLVLYWFQAHGRKVASEYSLKYYLVSDSIRLHRSDGALVRLMTPMYEKESADAAQARIMKLGDHFLPLLDNYIPR